MLILGRSSVVQSTEDKSRHSICDTDIRQPDQEQAALLANFGASDAPSDDPLDSESNLVGQDHEHNHPTVSVNLASSSKTTRSTTGGNRGAELEPSSGRLSVTSRRSRSTSSRVDGGFLCAFHDNPGPDRRPLHRTSRKKYVAWLG